jgi:RNA polymerase sigma factor (sigma-70 family)
MARSLRSLWTAATRPGDLPTDAELLARFTTAADHAAFELLARRHAAAVWAACRGVLKNDADTDDAAQVAFFTLARHARKVKAGATLGAWLHRVAVNAALKLRAKRRPTLALPEVSASPTEPDDSAAVLHEELARLPAAYREVLVAVDLEGYSHTDAATVLGWAVGTVSGRLVRARAQLKDRLERRGVTAAVVGATVSGSSVRAAAEVAVGAVVAPPLVASLSTEVWAMVATGPRKLVAAVACAVGLFALGGAGVVVFAQTPKPADPPKVAQKADPPVSAKERKRPNGVFDAIDRPKLIMQNDDPAEVKVAKKWLQAEVDRLGMIEQRILAGQFTGGSAYLQVSETLADLTNAADEAFPDIKERLPWYQFRLEVAERGWEFNLPRVKQGVEEPQLLPQLQADRAKAELALLKVQKKLKK